MKKFLTIFISVTILFLLIEVFFRLWFPQSLYSITTAPWGFKHIPNTIVTFYEEKPKWGWGQRGVEIEYDWDGCRGTNVKWDRGFNILCLGDSWVEDMGSPENNLFTAYLEHYYSKLYFEDYKNNKPVNVYNAGHYAFDNAQELMWYEMEGSKYKPDIVFLFYARDTASPEYAYIDQNGLVLTPKVFTPTQRAYRTVVSLVRRKTHFGSWVLNRLKRLQPVDKSLIIVGPDSPPDIGGFRAIDAMIYQRLNESVKPGILIMVNCLNEWPEEKKVFFEENEIRYMDLDYDVINKCRRQKAIDITEGNYRPELESHRMGYRANSAVADMLIKYLKKENLI